MVGVKIKISIKSSRVKSILSILSCSCNMFVVIVYKSLGMPKFLPISLSLHKNLSAFHKSDS